MSDADNKNIIGGMAAPDETITAASGALSDATDNVGTKSDDTAAEEYGQLSFDFCKTESEARPNRRARRTAESEHILDKRAENAPADDDGYEQLSFDFAVNAAKSEPDAEPDTKEEMASDAESIQEAKTEHEGSSDSDSDTKSKPESEIEQTAAKARDLPADIVIDKVIDKSTDEEAAEDKEEETDSAGSKTAAKQPESSVAAAPKSRKKPSHKSHLGRRILIGAAALLAAAYCVGIYYFSLHFLPNSLVQGVDISYLDAVDAEAKLQSDIVYDSIVLKGRTGDEVLSLTDTDVVKHFSSMQEAINAQDKLLWAKALLIKDRDTGIKLSVNVDEDKLNAAISALGMLNPDNITQFSNAHPKLNTETNLYEVEAETEGNDIDTEAFTEAVREAIADGCNEIDLDEAGVYKEPTMRSDSSLLAGQIDWMNAINSAGASMDLGAGVVIPVNGELIGALVGADGMADETAVRNYVTWIAVTYNTSSPDKTRTFVNHNNVEKVISTSYGWELNEDKTYPLLFELINKVIFDTTVNNSAIEQGTADTGSSSESGEQTATEAESAETAADASAESTSAFNPADYAIAAVWKRTAASHAENDLGASYIEIDMGEQNVYVYVDGSCVLTTPCVTGRMTKGRITPEGMYQIQYKQKNRYLTGRNPNGSISYRSFVHYWMPFNGGIGLHDATWRSKFGGNLYVGGGSHGCINLPLDMAQQLYDIVYKGMPVVCYY